MVAVHPQIYATVLVGQRNLLLEGLAHILDKTEFQIVARAASVDRLTPADMQEHKSVLLLLDAGSEVNTAIRQVQSFKQQHAAARIAVVIGALPSADMALLFHAGVNVCFAESASIAVFLKALKLVMLGETLVPATVLSPPRQEEARSPEVPPSGPARLSPQEGHVLRNLAEGHANKIIARKLGTAESTVKVHVKNILRKIGVANRTQATRRAINRGLLKGSKEEGAAAPDPGEGETTQPAATSSIRDENAPKLPPGTTTQE
jgi:two-component system nitrate/nitrite response regulator NarL